MVDVGQVDAIYTHFSKAFDCVNHDLLLFKLIKLGVRSDLVNWFGSYLKGRTQIVMIVLFFLFYLFI